MQWFNSHGITAPTMPFFMMKRTSRYAIALHRGADTNGISLLPSPQKKYAQIFTSIIHDYSFDILWIHILSYNNIFSYSNLILFNNYSRRVIQESLDLCASTIIGVLIVI